MAEEKKSGGGLRVFVQGGGCSGFQYGLMIEEGEGDASADRVFELVWFYQNHGRRPEAIGWLEPLTSHRLPAIRASTWLGLGQLTEQAGDFAKAVAYYEDGLKEQPSESRVRYFLNNNIGYAIACEELFEVEVPPRGQYVRVIMAELSRIADHVISVGLQGMDLGAFGNRNRPGIGDADAVPPPRRAGCDDHSIRGEALSASWR